MTNQGQSIRKNTFIDIPLEIALPHFIQDDKVIEDGPLFGNFKLSLQSVVCHRGTSVHSGHYISLIRGTSIPSNDDTSLERQLSNSSLPPQYKEDRWIKFDDLASERVTYTDIDQAMKDEMPYLLFYQVQSLYDISPPASDPGCEPPSYTDSAIAMNIKEATPEAQTLGSRQSSYFGLSNSYTAAEEPSRGRVSFSDDTQDRPRQSLSVTADPYDLSRRGSLAFTDASVGSATSLKTAPLPSIPTTPIDEDGPSSRLSRAAWGFSKPGSKSRPGSQVGENRISSTFSRLGMMRSKELLYKAETAPEQTPSSVDGAEADSAVDRVQAADMQPVHEGLGRKRSKKEKGRHHAGKEKLKGKQKSAVPERECMLM